MTSLTCLQLRRLMDGRVAGLREPDRLRLEDHLADCGECLVHSRALESLRTLAQTAASSVTESARRRVIDRAIAQAGASCIDGSVAAPLRSNWIPVVAGALAVAAAVVFAFAPPSASESTPHVHQPTTARAERFVSTEPQHIVVTGAELELARFTAVDWNARTATVILRAGEVGLQVASRSGQIPFRVVTPHFVVVVIGTEFHVTIDSVSVVEGVVRIESLEGRVLKPALRAGETWTLQSDAPTAAMPSDTPTIEPAADAARAPAVSSPQWLATARSRLARGDVSGARVALAQSRLQPMPRADRAEAETLVAECFQVEGEVRQAIEQYTKVAHGYRGSGAGDNAAYAAARLALTRDDLALSARLLQSYLREYPQGRFRTDASVALSKLGRGSVR